MVFPRAEFPPPQNHGNTTTPAPPRPREYHDPPGDRWNPTTPPHLTSKSLPHLKWGGGGGRGIPVALGNIRPWEYHDPGPLPFSRPPSSLLKIYCSSCYAQITNQFFDDQVPVKLRSEHFPDNACPTCDIFRHGGSTILSGCHDSPNF